MLDFISKLLKTISLSQTFEFISKDKPGALIDNRPVEKIKKDFLHEEIAMAPEVKYEEKKVFNTYPNKDQDGSSSCVPNAVTKLMGIENLLEEGEYVDLSARYIYTQRRNYPDLGMYFDDALDIACNKGATLEVLLPSQGKSEPDMNNSRDIRVSDNQVARIFKAKNYVRFNNIDIDTIAGIISQGKGVILGFRFTRDEWQAVPIIKNPYPALAHAVVGVDYTLYKGKKAIVVDESWGINNATQRIITEDFLKARCFYAGYIIDLPNNWQEISKPKFDGSIKSLQDVLKYERLFPATQVSTGVFGGITLKALTSFQLRYGLPQTGKVDEITKNKLLELYN